MHNNTSEAMRVGIYARVSTYDQNCAMQLADLRTYYASRQWAIFDEFVDTGFSGGKNSRPQLDRLMAAARMRKLDCVIVWKLDRWGRNLVHCLESIQELRALGVRWIAITQNLDTDESNPMSRLMLTLMAAFAEFEREMIQERVRAGVKSYGEDYAAGKVGKLRHSHSGKDLAMGRPERIFDRAKALKLRKSGKSIREISRALKVGKGTIERLLKASQKPISKPKKAR
jgi:putative DNA-invertase from lambdoid prophage Rac